MIVYSIFISVSDPLIFCFTSWIPLRIADFICWENFEDKVIKGTYLFIHWLTIQVIISQRIFLSLNSTSISEEINTNSWTDFSELFSIKIRHFTFIECPLNYETSILWLFSYCDLWKNLKRNTKIKVKFTLENELQNNFLM